MWIKIFKQKLINTNILQYIIHYINCKIKYFIRFLKFCFSFLIFWFIDCFKIFFFLLFTGDSLLLANCYRSDKCVTLPLTIKCSASVVPLSVIEKTKDKNKNVGFRENCDRRLLQRQQLDHHNQQILDAGRKSIRYDSFLSNLK